MSLEASTLSIVVKGDGIADNTKALEALAKAGDKAEKSVGKLSETNKGAEASAKKQEALWYDLIAKASAYYERQFNVQQKALQRENQAAEAALLREAQTMNRAFDKRVADEAATYKKLQDQADKYYAQQQRDQEASYKKLQREADKYNAQKVADANAALKRESQALAQAYAQQQAEGNRMNRAFDARQAQQQAEGMARVSAEYRRLTEATMQSRTAMHGHNQEMENAHALVRGLSGSLGALWLTYGNILPLIAGAAIGAAIKESVSGFIEVQYQMTFMKALTEDTTHSVKELTDRMHGVAGGLGINPEAASKGLRALAQAGLDTDQALRTLPDAFKLATVGELPLEQAALAGISVMNAYGKSVDSFSHIGDVMAKAGAMSAASVSSMTESFKYSAGTAEQYGVSLEKLAASLTLLGKRSITGSSAGVAVNNLITETYSPSSEKAKQAQQALGVKAYVNGVRQNFEDVIQQIKDGLKKFDPESQGILLEAMYGKKGGKAYYAVAQQSKETFLQMEHDLVESSGFTADVYRKSLETVRGQLELTKSAISNMFSTVGEESEAPLKSLLQTVRGFANDPVVKDAFAGLAQSIKTMLTVALPVAGVVGGVWGAMKLGTTVIAALSATFARLAAVNLVNFFAQALASLTLFVEGVVTMNATLLLSNPIFIAITGLVAAAAGAYLLLHKNQSSVIELHDQEMKNSREVQDSLSKEIGLLEKKLELQGKGVKAEDMDAEVRKAKYQDVATKAREELAQYQKDLADSQKQGAIPGMPSYAVGTNTTKIMSEIEKRKQIIKEQEDNINKETALQEKVKNLRRNYDINTFNEENEADYLPKLSPDYTSGDKKFDPKAEKAAQKAINWYQQEMLELQKLGASYDAKTKAMLEFYRTGSKVAADSQQAIVEVNRLSGKYASDDMYLKALGQAKIVDEAKFRNEKTKTFVELTGNMEKIVDGEEAFQKAAKESGVAKLGYYARQVEAAKVMLGWTDKEIAKAREQASVADEIKRAEEARQKLTSAADNARSRAGEASAEIDAMEAYGTKAKATALNIAKLAIEKARLSSAGDQAIKDNLLEAAATEQLQVAYRDLLKDRLALNNELERSQADSLEMFGQNEIERVRIATDAEKKIAALKLANAQDAFNDKAMSGTATFEDVKDINAANKAYADTLNVLDKISQVKMDNILTKDAIDRWKDLGNVVEDGLTKSFGKAGAAAGKMFNLFANGQARDMQTTKQIATLREREAKDGISRAADIDNLQRDSAQSRLGEYAGMADAAKGFFNENSKGYEAMTKAAQVLHIAEVGLSLIKGVNAVLTQGEGDPYTAFARMAAMTALVAGLGVAISGGGGGGMSSADKQKVQGTGSVLGSRTTIVDGEVKLVGEKSESITKSLSILEKNSSLGLVQDRGMLQAMRTLSNSISSLAAKVAGDSSLTGEYASDQQGTASSLSQKILFSDPFSKALDKVFGGFLSKATGKIANAIFGGNKTVTDTGFTMGSATNLASLLSNGVKAGQYTQVKTDGGLFHSDKSNTSTTSLGADINNQFTAIIKNMTDSLQAAAKVFGVSGDAFTAKLNSFVVDIGQISLKDMTGDEIEKALNSVFSKLGDDMAGFAFSDLRTFQKVGEGMLETISRVANNLLQVKDVFQVLDKSLPSGWLGTFISEKIVDAFGSADNLTSSVSTYMSSILTEDQNAAILKKNVDAAMASLGYAGVTTKAQFKSIVDGLDLTKDSDIALFNSLMNVAEGFGKVADASEATTKTTVDNLQSTIDKLKDFSNSIKQFRDGLATGELSTLTPEQKLAAAASQYQTILQKAMAGDEDAQGRVTDAAQTYLEQARNNFASSNAYTAIFDKVNTELSGVSDWADKQVSDAQKQIDQLQGLNATAADISGTLNSIATVIGATASPVTAIVPVGQMNGANVTGTALSAMAALLAEVKQAVEKGTNNIVGATVDSNAESADKIAAAVSDASTSNAPTTYAVAAR